MRYSVVLLLVLMVLFSIGCSKKIVLVKAAPAEPGQDQIIGEEKANLKASDNHLIQAKKFYAEKRFKQAQKHCERAISFNHRNWQAHYYLGLILQERKEYVVSIDALGVCLKYSPANSYLKSEIHYAIGVNWEQLGDFKQAENEYGLALDYNPENKIAQKAKNRIKVEKTLKGWGKRRKNPYDG